MEFFAKSKGVISIFLIIIMLPLLTGAVILVDGTRYHSARTIVQEAGDLAAYSTIADYNMDLKEEYGLFALGANATQANFQRYFKDALLCSDASGNKSYSDKVQDFIGSTVFGGGDYKDATFFNLYNFQVEKATLTPEFPLSDPYVLQNQIVEYAKYRGLETLLERFEIISSFSGLAEQLNNNNEKAAAIEDLSQTDTIYASIAQSLKDLKGLMQDYNEKLGSFTTVLQAYEDACVDELCAIATKSSQIQSKKNARKNAKKAIVTWKEAVVSKRSGIIKKCDLIQISVNNAITSYTDLKARYSAQEDICGDIQKQLDILNMIVSTNEKNARYSIHYAKNIVDISSFVDDSLMPKVEECEQAFASIYERYDTEYAEKKAELEADELLLPSEIQEMLDEIRYHVYTKSGDEWFCTWKDHTGMSVDEEIKNKSAGFWVAEFDIDRYGTSHVEQFRARDFENYYEVVAQNEKEASTITVDDPEKEMNNAVSNANDSKNEKEQEDKKERLAKVNLKDVLTTEALNSLPSRVAKVGENSKKETGEVTKDNASLAIEGANEAFSELTTFLEAGRNDILTYAYMLDMFKTRVTGEHITSADKPPQGIHMRNLVDWRYMNDKGEQDLRYRTKYGQKTVFGSCEVEYIFGGSSSEATNAAIVYSWIYAMRLANNLVAVYTDSTAKAECEMLGALTSAAFSGVVPPAVFKWVYLTAWAAGETALELAYLTTDGYKVPLIKGKDSLFIQHFFDVGAAIKNRDSLIRAKYDSTAVSDKINVCYEDYLIILLCFVDRETRLLRMADLMQMNMQARHGGSFKMSEAYTYVRAETSVSMKYMFQPVQQFQNAYKGNGIRFSNVIYQGY